MKVRATIDLAQDDEIINDALGSVNNGSFGVDKEGAYRMWYHSRTDLVNFLDVVELEEDDKGIDIVKLQDLQWADETTGVGYVIIDGKKYTMILKEDDKHDS